MTNQLPSDWGLPEWGAEPGLSGDRRTAPVSGNGPGATTTRERPTGGRTRPQPPPPGPQGPRQGRRRLLSGVILGLLAITCAVIVGFIVLVMWVVSMARGPIDATNAFLAELDEGRVERAYASMCNEAKATYSLADFTSHVEASGAITGYTFASASVRSNEQTIVSGTIDVDDVPRAADFGLRQENEVWKVCSYPLIQE